MTQMSQLGQTADFQTRPAPSPRDASTPSAAVLWAPHIDMCSLQAGDNHPWRLGLEIQSQFPGGAYKTGKQICRSGCVS